MHFLGTENPDNLTGTSGDDQIEALASNDVVHGAAGNDSLDGGTGDDQLFGDAGVDDLYGGNGRDLLDGGAGGDQLYGSDGADILVGGAGADLIFGGDGIDTADYSGSAAAVTLQNGAGTGGDAAGDVLDGVESVLGSAFNDKITVSGPLHGVIDGGAGDDILSGPGTLLGGDGNDLLLDGAAILDGGAGIDTFSTDLSDAAINLAKSYVSAMDGTLEQIRNIENVIANGHHIHVTGTAETNVIDASQASGDNVLDGGAGNDTLIGGTADATVNRFIGGAGADRFESANTGNLVYDYVYYDSSSAAVSINLRAGFFFGGDAEGDRISFAGEKAVTGIIGSAFDDTIQAGNGNHTSLDNTVDYLFYGGDGNDTLAFGSGRDWMSGGAGADAFVYYDTDSGYYRRGFGDMIRDFSSAQGDKIDLSAIDADRDSSNGHTAFHFVGQDADPGIGEVGFTFHGGVLQVIAIAASDNNSRTSDSITVSLPGVATLTASDFHL
ncbi:hypothetical protein KXS07_14330 [Inquilinus limosus]|uniref:calcium-binding protein n=1 Tax=Inquilinus limosus TaxID=171674 RepID=UPI003F175BD9